MLRARKGRLVPGSAIAALILASTATAASASTNAAARLVLHLKAPVFKSACTIPSALPDCGQVKTNGDLDTYFAYVVLTNGSPTSGVSAAQFGIAYDPLPGSGVDVFSWTSCASGAISSGDWPASESGLRLTWDPCVTNEPHGAGSGVEAVAGFFYLSAYSPDELRIEPDHNGTPLIVEDCAHLTEYLNYGGTPPGGTIVFSVGGQVNGWNPCTPYPYSSVPCTIVGPRIITVGSTVTYSVLNPGAGVEYHWFHQGDAYVFDGPSIGPSVRVRGAGVGGGEFDVSSMGTSPISFGHTVVVVLPGHSPVVPATWSSIKLFPG